MQTEERAIKAAEKAKIAEERPKMKSQKTTHKRLEDFETGNGRGQEEKRRRDKRKTDINQKRNKLRLQEEVNDNICMQHMLWWTSR